MSDKLVLHAEQSFDSPWVFHVMVALEEKRLPYDLVVEDLPFTAARRAELAGRALLARVPLLAHGDLWLTESLAISEYLAETFPFPAHPRLFPSDHGQRARARQVMMYVRTDLAALRADRPTTTIFGGPPASTPLSPAAARQAEELVGVAAALVGPGATTMFDGWSIADADLALTLMRLVASGDPLPPRLADYARAQWRRPSVQAFIARRPRS